MTGELFSEIPGSYFFKKIQRIKGTTPVEEVYHVERKTGFPLLLTLTPLKEYDRKKAEFSSLKRLYSHGIPMPRPEEFGICKNRERIYFLNEEIEGAPSTQIIRSLTTERQYHMGYNAGQILAKIHQLSPPTSFDWKEYFEQLVEDTLLAYKKCSAVLKQEKILLSMVKKTPPGLENRPIRILHGDFQPENFLITSHQTIAVTGFCHQIGDPWCDFCTLPLSYNLSIPFAAGQIDGYFAGKAIPKDFFEITSFYLAADALSSFCWACKQEEAEQNAVQNNIDMLCEWYQNFETTVPNWY